MSARNFPFAEKSGQEWIVVGEFGPYEARVIADALERDGLHAEAETWRDAADAAEHRNGGVA